MRLLRVSLGGQESAYKDEEKKGRFIDCGVWLYIKLTYRH